ncbi:IS1 family transposase [Nostoc flagelliforme FACHB-838]|uniref:IS1 family transposase n=1 Tax=Nostoc flagelliforme FACHB-838 TaxID=2692904 RepID=A0ABR8DYL4_9NOSO|nr:IS1 family transposase [Nostoc flagelliforme FACHB-838]
MINWVKKAGKSLPNSPDYDEIPEITQVDELETFVGKKNKVWLWTAVNKNIPGILAWVLGDRSSETFKVLWQIISCWHSYFYVTDGNPVYPCFISNEDHIVSKTMTRVEGENSRLRHYLARLHRKTFCYSKSEEMLRYSIRLVIHYLKYGTDVLRALCARKLQAMATPAAGIA